MLTFKLLYLLPALIVGGGLFLKLKFFKITFLELSEIKAFSQPLEAKARGMLLRLSRDKSRVAKAFSQVLLPTHLGVGVSVLRRGFTWAEPHKLGEPARPQVESKPDRAK